jgi:4-hydroxy-3-polyprenylbenzoate decarboxylase
MPLNPGFYHHPQSVQDIVDFVVASVMIHLGMH